MPDSPHTNCTEHSGLIGRLNLLIAMMVIALGGTTTVYVSINGQLRELDKAVAVTAKSAEMVEATQRHILVRLDRLEGVR
jgi:hypothetical protein